MIDRVKDRLVCSLAINMDECIDLTRRPMRLYADRVDADFFVLNHSNRNPPHLAKYDLLTAANTAGYEQVLYLDADVYVRRGVPNIFEHYTNALFDETPPDGYFEQHHHLIAKDMKELLKKYKLGDPYFNTGVMVFDREGLQSLCSVFNDYTEFTTHKTYFEQHQLNAFIHRAGIWTQHLSRRWNSFASDKMLTERYLLDSYFVHTPGIKNPKHRVAKLKQIKDALP